MILSVGRSPAGQRIREAGLRFQREKRQDPLYGAPMASKYRTQQIEREWRRQKLESQVERLLQRQRIFDRHAYPMVGHNVAPETYECAADEIAYKHHMTVEELRSDKRKHSFAAARKEFSKVMSKLGASYADIGRYLGNRDHTTIQYYVKGRKHAGK